MINSTHEDLYKQNTNILFVHDSSGWCVREFNKLSRVLREKLTVFRLVKNFTFYGTRMFMTAFTGACQFSPSGARSIQSTFSEAITFNIHFNIILQSTARSFQWPLSFSFPPWKDHRQCWVGFSKPVLGLCLYISHIWPIPIDYNLTISVL